MNRIVSLLRDNPTQSYTTHGVVEAIKDSAPELVISRYTFKILANMARDPKTEIVSYKIHHRLKHNKSTHAPQPRPKSVQNDTRVVTYYKWSPARKLIDQFPERTDDYVSSMISAYVKHNPGASTTNIVAGITDLLGHIDDRVVRDCLHSRVEAGAIVVVPGPQSAHRHYRPDAVPAPQDEQMPVRKLAERVTIGKSTISTLRKNGATDADILARYGR